MVLQEKKMPVNLFSEVHNDMDLIFIHFIFFFSIAGIVRALAIGDFTVNLGQGLIQWQSLSFTKSSQALAIKREASCLRPYHSAGEFNFHRGLGDQFTERKMADQFIYIFSKNKYKPGNGYVGKK